MWAVRRQHFEMRGFTFGEVNILYNGISIGPSNITSRVMETASLAQVEFLKGPSAIMTGLDAIGGSVNFVSRQPTTGPIKSELDTSIDTLGTYRAHFGSGGSTNISGLDYRFDISSSKINSFIDGDYDNLNNVSGQLNYRVNDAFKVFAAVDYKRDDGHAYWGTPLTTTAFSGPFSTHGVVAGSANNIFFGTPETFLSSVTVDSRTTTTNYNVADNSVGAHELWLRGGFELKVTEDVTIKNQAYEYGAKRHWFDSETYAFNPTTSLVDRDRFFVTHKQQVIGNNTDVAWDSSFFGMENRLAGQIQVSRNDITFAEEGNPNAFPFDSVDPDHSDSRILRRAAAEYPQQHAGKSCGLGRGSLEDHAVVCLDRRHPRRRYQAVARRHQFRRHDSRGPALHQELAAGILSRGRHFRADQGTDVLRHVRHRLRSGDSRHFFAVAGKLGGPDQRTHLRDRSQG